MVSWDAEEHTRHAVSAHGATCPVEGNRYAVVNLLNGGDGISGVAAENKNLPPRRGDAFTVSFR